MRAVENDEISLAALMVRIDSDVKDLAVREIAWICRTELPARPYMAVIPPPMFCIAAFT